MSFSTTSFLAGVGTVFAAVALGFAGGAMITTSPKVEPNRLERVTAGAAATATIPDAGVKTAIPEVRSVVATKTPEETAAAPRIETAAAPTTETKDEMPQSAPVIDRVISQTPAPAPQAVPPQPAPVTVRPVVARDDADVQADSPRKARDDQARKESASRNAERRAERRRERRRRDIEGAEDAVLQIQPDDGPTISQRYEQRFDRGPRFGFFGDE